MAIIKYIEDEATYSIVDGKLFNVKYQDSYGKNCKPFAKYGINFDYAYNSSGEIENKTIWCSAWGRIAEIVDSLVNQNKFQVLVMGKIRENEWNGERREILECTWVQPLYEIPKERIKKEEPEYEDINF